MRSTKPYFSKSPDQYSLGAYGPRQIAQNPAVSAKDLARVYGELEYFVKHRGVSMGAIHKATLKDIASNPQATPEMLAALLRFFPEEVKNNPVWDLYFWENPQWITQFVPDIVKSPSEFEEYLNILVKHKILLFTGFSYYIPVTEYHKASGPWTARTSSRETVELRLTNMGYVQIIHPRDKREWADSLDVALIRVQRYYGLDVDETSLHTQPSSRVTESYKRPYFSKDARQMNLDSYRSRLVAQDPAASVDALKSAFKDHKLFLNMANPDWIPTEHSLVLKNLAENPNTPPAMLAKLIHVYPHEVRNNLSFQLAFLEDPHWLIKAGPTTPAKQLKYFEMLHKQGVLPFTGRSLFFKSPNSALEIKFTVGGPVFAMYSFKSNYRSYGGSAYASSGWFKTAEDAFAEYRSGLRLNPDDFDSGESAPSTSAGMPEAAPFFDVLSDIRALLNEARGDVADLRAVLTAKKDCAGKTHDKGEGTYKYPYAWHAQKKECHPLPVHVAAETTTAHEQSSRAHREGKSLGHKKATEAHVNAARVAERAGYADLAAAHKKHAESHRDLAVKHAHVLAKDDLHKDLSKKISGAAEEPKPSSARGRAITRVQ